MKLWLIGIGRLKAGPERALFEKYYKRLSDVARSQGLSSVELREFDEGRAAQAAGRQAEEAQALLGVLPKGARLIALDERGAAMSSPQWAADIAKARDAAVASYVVALGGPDGHDPSVRARADLMVSFGAMTWPHQLARAMACEQLYRAVSILAGHPYHRQ